MNGALTEIEAVARELGASALADEARALGERAREGRFFVACVGQFKRGKSTLLNALVETEVLPTGTVPVTSVVTVLRYGPAPSARVRREGAAWEEVGVHDLVEYVSEERNPSNARRILAVEVFLPSEILASGLCFVDTPGLGSVFTANTGATREFVPHVDAALVVFGADPPISGEELSLVGEIAREVDTFVFVLNKADRVSDQECDEAAAFAERVLSQRLGHPGVRVYRVSSLERLSAGKATRDWDALCAELGSLAKESGQILVQGAVERGVARFSTRLLNVAAEERAAMERPLRETEERITTLRQASYEAARALWELAPLFDAELQRLGKLFESRRSAFIQETLRTGGEELNRAVHGSDARFGPSLRVGALHAAKQIAQSRVLPWLRAGEQEAEAEYRETTARFAVITNGLLARLRSSEAWSAVPLPTEVGNGGHLKGRSRFRFDTFAHVESPAGIVPLVMWVADAVLPRSMTERRVERGAREYLERLVVTNAHRVENSIKQRLQDSRLQLESELRYALKEVLEAAERGMERAKCVQAEGRDAVRAEVSRIDGLCQRINCAVST